MCREWQRAVFNKVSLCISLSPLSDVAERRPEAAIAARGAAAVTRGSPGSSHDVLPAHHRPSACRSAKRAATPIGAICSIATLSSCRYARGRRFSCRAALSAPCPLLVRPLSARAHPWRRPVQDKWEYPWYASWDSAFHMIPMAVIDPFFAKQQLLLFLREWYMNPNGMLRPRPRGKRPRHGEVGFLVKLYIHSLLASIIHRANSSLRVEL